MILISYTLYLKIAQEGFIHLLHKNRAVDSNAYCRNRTCTCEIIINNSHVCLSNLLVAEIQIKHSILYYIKFIHEPSANIPKGAS